MIDFYFDFISPYGYFGAVQINALAKKHNQKVEWHSMLLGVSVMNVMGLKPLLDTPLKGDNVLKDIPHLSALYGIPVKIPKHGFPNPVPAARAFYFFKEHAPEQASSYALAIYHALWRDGLDISDPELLAKLMPEAGLTKNDLITALTSDELKTLVKSKVGDSIDKGIFGAPTFVVDNEMIWGADRLWMLDHWLTHLSWSNA